MRPAFPVSKLEVSMPGEGKLCLGPLFGFSPETILRRSTALIRAALDGYLSTDLPLVRDSLIEASKVACSPCSFYDLYCFASPKHPRFISLAKETSSTDLLRSFLNTAEGRRILDLMVNEKEEDRKHRTMPPSTSSQGLDC
jgi:hypothetical protein